MPQDTISKTPTTLKGLVKFLKVKEATVNQLKGLVLLQPESLISRKFALMGGDAFFGPLVEKKSGIAWLYKNGCVCYNPSEHEAYEIHGAIYQKWLILGGLSFGVPNTDETATSVGAGRFNHFNNSTASIYWTSQTGANAIYGAIRQKWASLGSEKSFLGYPTSDELGITGGRFNNFQFGQITWSSAAGAGVSFTSANLQVPGGGGGLQPLGVDPNGTTEVRRRVVIAAHMDLTDHETFGSNEHSSADAFGEAIITNAMPQETMKMTDGAGGEMRVELTLNSQASLNGDIRITGNVLLYEGTSEQTEDLDGSESISFVIPRDNFTSKTYTVRNEDEGDDFAVITLSASNFAI